MHRELWRYDAARVAMRVGDDAIAVVEAVGLLNESTLRRLAIDVHTNETIAERARAVISDYRRAVVAVGLRGLDWSDVLDISLIKTLPVAIVVGPVDEQMFIDYSWLRAQGGFVRAVFTDIEEAFDWASSRATGSTTL